ncbi:phenylalanine 4-monooxygenase [Larkinella rosea]|uniref:phenylalanine 4-monooxygenase n=1 Tax=Larkinella rosea TaxID=2025312 RepID=A0A3P1BM34_9BACT|nr:phenylalanine 4-monooxygenase [Larkinella rosea]RRB02075.1 phenylalanine 4-monooxygenase [Larkinella rosea]
MTGFQFTGFAGPAFRWPGKTRKLETVNYKIMSQAYHTYTADDQAVWRLLFERQMKLLPGKASQEYLDGIGQVGFVADHIPNFEKELNPRLLRLTNWRVSAVPGLISNRDFFELMQNRNFPATTWLRRREQLEYLQEPDMFHDTFGHVPMLSNQAFCDFLAALSRIALAHVDHPEAIEMISRLYWYTVEFGLIQEPAGSGRDRLRIYGGGILSSTGETSYSLSSPQPERVPYDVGTLLRTPYVIDRFQDRYFVIDSFEQLYHSIPEIEGKLEELLVS